MKNIKKLAVTLAFSQLLSTNTFALANEKKNDSELVKCNYTLVSEKNNLYSFEEENDNYYCRFNENSGKYEPISIFDEENISSSQYGANQKDFKINFKKIIRDPLIINEMQNYYPIEEFESIDEAMFFYEKYFDLIYKCGCGYVAATNYIFHLYEGKEEEFYNTFGYPMYNISKDGSVDFNYEIFTLSFFNFSIKEMGISKKEIINSILKDWYERKLNEYMKSEEYTKKLPDNFQSWTDEEWNEWYQFDKDRENKFHNLFEKWSNAKNSILNLGLPLNASFGYFYLYLSRFGIKTSIKYRDLANNYQMDDIIASEKFNLYCIDDNEKITNEIDNVDSHYVYITDITEDGKIVVSSWGKKYIFDDTNALWTSKILIKTNH